LKQIFYTEPLPSLVLVSFLSSNGRQLYGRYVSIAQSTPKKKKKKKKKKKEKGGEGKKKTKKNANITHL